MLMVMDIARSTGRRRVVGGGGFRDLPWQGCRSYLRLGWDRTRGHSLSSLTGGSIVRRGVGGRGDLVGVVGITRAKGQMGRGGHREARLEVGVVEEEVDSHQGGGPVFAPAPLRRSPNPTFLDLRLR